jgi:glutamate N-acetyltransferase/amino-acid N-acetyltransferase
LDISRVDISLEDVVVFRNGTVDPLYTESAGQAVMKKPDITVCIDLHRGQDEARIWTTDLSHEYVRINAEYRT